MEPAPVSRKSTALCAALWSLLLIASCLILTYPADSRVPLGLPDLRAVPDDPAHAAAVEAGKTLFFDRRLSADGTISCASCHRPDKAFSDGLISARGIRGQLGTRNTPTLWNVAFNNSLFWDGRREGLAQQATDPMLNPREHGLADLSSVIRLVQHDDVYSSLFRRAFRVMPTSIREAQIAAALAAFERTLIAGDSAFDRYQYGRDPTALSAGAVRGLTLFRGRARCVTCHVIESHYALLTDNEYHSLGVGMQDLAPHLAQTSTRVANASPKDIDVLISQDVKIASLGRFVITRQPRDIGKFRTPSLRNVALTAPYMHDGSARTLADAVDLEIYYRGLEANAPLILTPEEKSDLIDFLRSLTSPEAQHYMRTGGAGASSN